MCLCRTGAMPEAVVCINQADIGEKTDQVGVVRDLYGIATSVVVFLGEESDDTVVTSP